MHKSKSYKKPILIVLVTFCLIISSFLILIFYSFKINNNAAAEKSNDTVLNNNASDIADSLSLDTNGDQLADYIFKFTDTTLNTKLKLISVDNSTFGFMDRQVFNYEIISGDKSEANLTLTFNKIENGDIQYFIDYKPSVPGLNLDYTIIASGMDNSYEMRTAAKQTGIVQKSAEEVSFNLIKNNADVTQLDNASAYIDYSKNGIGRYLRLGRIYYVNSLGYTVYDIGFEPNPVGLASLDNESGGMNFTYELPVKAGYTTRTDGILSSSRLIDWSNATAVRTAGILGLNGDTLIWTDGMYKNNYDSYSPRSEHSIYKIPWASSIKACHWVINNGNLFQDVAISMMYAYINNYNSGGFIPTAPQSEWLSNDYGIGHNFYDTRFNTDTALALLYIYGDFKDESVLEAVKDYTKFYLDYMDNHSFEIKGATFVSDYMDESGENKPTHCSLNHYLAEMDFLYKYYEVTNDKDALKAARDIRDSISLTYKKWIKPDGDLWYMVSPDGKFTRDDYPLVTYNDLKYSITLLQEVDGSVPEQFAKLINSKESWAKKNGWLS